MDEGWFPRMGSGIASLVFLLAVISKYFPVDAHLEHQFSRCTRRLARLVYPYIQIKFQECKGERMKRSEAYTDIENYLANTCSGMASRLRGEMVKDGSRLELSIDDYEDVVDTFRGATFWWSSKATTSKANSFFMYPIPDERRYYQLTFDRKHQDFREAYLEHVVQEGRAAIVKKRQRKLYTNSSNTEYGFKRRMWIHVPFEHPATFDTVAMDPVRKQAILRDLTRFSQSRDYYARIGKAWKRGYLLYGPPGTGKSSLVAAMANLLDYDVYDLELTAVKDNTMLRKLLIETEKKSIIVVEDVDCSLDLTGTRKKKKKQQKEGGGGDETVHGPRGRMGEDSREDSKVTLSGLLNFIDGLWSASGGERLIVFTTNHVEKLDPALIRRGRMDMHIELSYCQFEAFKVLAWNYLRIKEHPLFDKVRELMAEAKITPADVAETLIPKNKVGTGEEEATACLQDLIAALEGYSRSEPIKDGDDDDVDDDEEEEDHDTGGGGGHEKKHDTKKACDGKDDGRNED